MGSVAVQGYYSGSPLRGGWGEAEAILHSWAGLLAWLPAQVGLKNVVHSPGPLARLPDWAGLEAMPNNLVGNSAWLSACVEL